MRASDYWIPACAGMTSIQRQAIKELDPALFSDLVVGLVDGGDLLGGERHELLGHAARDQLVGMVLGDELTVLALQLLIANGGLDPQHIVRIALGSDDVARLDIGELGVRHADTPRNTGAELLP